MDKYIYSILLSVVLAGCESKSDSVGMSGGVGFGGYSGGNYYSAGVEAPIDEGRRSSKRAGAPLNAKERETLQLNAPNTLNRIDNGRALTVDDIKKMSSVGLKESTIINQIIATNSVFYLSTQEIRGLRRSGVSQRVIDAMVESSASLAKKN